MPNKFVFRKNWDIGSLEAETDAFLQDTFTDKGDIEILKDTENVRSIIVGRTGSGKSALLRYLEASEEKVTRINPEAMSLRYLSNSDIIRYLKQLGTNLDLFYKVLWKHVFIVEFLKMHFGAEAHKENSSMSLWLQSLINPRKKEAINYLRAYHTDFWEKTEIRVKTIEEQIKTKLTKALNITPSAFDKLISGKIEGDKESVHIEKSEIANKAQLVISELQADAIYRVVDILREDIFNKKQQRCYIIIDDLDKDWVDITIVYDLIRALVVTINELRAIPSTKIIIALRDNLYEKALQETDSRRMQREKFRQLNLTLEWNPSYLKTLINRRLSLLMKRQYSSATPDVDEIMPKASGNKLSGFEYIVKRTLLRPRDVIAFFNKCIEKANEQSVITRDIVSQAEPEYSRERLEAIDDEWAENFGSIKPLCNFLRNGPSSFKIKELTGNQMESTLLAHITEKQSIAFKIQQDYVVGVGYSLTDAIKNIVCILYRVGILGVKVSPSDATVYSHSSSVLLEPSDLSDNSKCYVHLMFHAALKIINKE